MSKDEDGTGVLGLEDEGTFDWLDLVLDGASTTWADLEDDMFTLLVVGLFRGLAVPLTDSALEEPFAGDVDTEALVLTSEVGERGRGVVVVEGGFGGVDLLLVGASTLKDEFSSDLVENLSGCVALLLIDWRLGVFLAIFGKSVEQLENLESAWSEWKSVRRRVLTVSTVRKEPRGEGRLSAA
ncbi:hypothetical protein AXG93_606s1000 [Marchantia polymorpha subsp. ruderalis]|uniref:Uncharacterized protein n=1 Tax=Marchantia polymorpha subsp. ruderalis TaxID=1480154 RepID=A0A176VML2_MARPO|nr:hypothetical protein AXG93_606s1000 [Marchantia polymorpha subsp. ruderalis]